MQRSIQLCLAAICTLVAGDRKNGFYCYGDGPLSKDQPCRFFAAVIDAGSTGTRLHLYRYVYNTDPSGIPIVVEEETFKEVKPGLSSFNNNPKGAAATVRDLLQLARATVPHFMWEKTPITLKATAGLRLLPGDMADDILTEVEDEIFNSGFFAVPNAVSIMSGSDEGTYSWFTLNLLLNTLYSKDSKSSTILGPQASRSAAAFDLGGGSTQLTFWPSHDAIFDRYSGYERHIDFFGHNLKLFTHSFLGNGLVAARLNVLMGSTPVELQEDDKLTSSCLPEDFHLIDWEYALKKWSINGTSSYSYENCYETAREFVHKSDIMQLTDLRGKMVYLFSYFFDRGLNSGLVEDINGGPVKLADYKEAARIACSRPSSALHGPHWMPWQCHDLTYIYSLLHDGYGFADDQPLFLAKKIKGMEVAWAQGLSYALINEFNDHQQNHPMTPPSNATNTTVVDQLWSYILIGTNNILSYLNIITPNT